MERCPWCLCNEKMTRYHDEEWGIPLHDDYRQFEFLMMEVMQCGLNWNMMIQKREIFRQCFDGFDYDKVAAYGDGDVERILAAEGMIRSRRKVEAVIHNARRNTVPSAGIYGLFPRERQSCMRGIRRAGSRQATSCRMR